MGAASEESPGWLQGERVQQQPSLAFTVLPIPSDTYCLVSAAAALHGCMPSQLPLPVAHTSSAWRWPPVCGAVGGPWWLTSGTPLRVKLLRAAPAEHAVKPRPLLRATPDNTAAGRNIPGLT